MNSQKEGELTKNRHESEVNTKTLSKVTPSKPKKKIKKLAPSKIKTKDEDRIASHSNDENLKKMVISTSDLPKVTKINEDEMKEENRKRI